MSDGDHLERVRAIVERVAGPARSVAGAGPDTRLGEDGFWLDSAGMLEVILACEEEFGIVFDWEGELSPAALHTLGSLAETIRSKTR